MKLRLRWGTRICGRIWGWIGVLDAEFSDYDGCESAGGRDAAGDQRCGGQADWAHGILLDCELCAGLAGGLGVAADAVVHCGPAFVHPGFVLFGDKAER